MERTSPPPIHFNAPWGLLLKLMTMFFFLLLIGLPVYVLYTGKIQAGGPAWMFYSLPFILLAAYFFLVRGYEVAGNELRILRPGWYKTIKLDNLRSVDFIPRAMQRSIRTFGNGGLFSFVGHFRNKLLGPYKAYATDFHKTVVLKFADRTIVVTPDEPEKFKELVAQFISRGNQTTQGQ